MTAVYQQPVYRQSIALISICHDPASEPGRETEQSNAVRQLGQALAKLGWQVDLFTRKTQPEQPKIVQHAPYCRFLPEQDNNSNNKDGSHSPGCGVASKAEAKAALGVHPIDRLILCVSSASDQGIETLLEAFAKINREEFNTAHLVSLSRSVQLRWVLVGNYTDEAARYIKQRLKPFGIQDQVIWVGTVTPSLLSLYYTAAEACIVPNPCEPFGSVALEAIISGIPVIASRQSGLRFVIVPEETGLLVPPGDARALAAAVCQILSDELWITRLRRHASAPDPSLSWITIAAHLSDLYRRLPAHSISPNLTLNLQNPYVLGTPDTRVARPKNSFERKLVRVS